jgi:hypothetical protein
MRYSTTRKTLLLAKTATGAGSAENGVQGNKQYFASGTTTAGAGAAVILVQGSCDEGANWNDIGSISLTLATTTSSDDFLSQDAYTLVRGNVQSISGTGASVNLSMGY